MQAGVRAMMVFGGLAGCAAVAMAALTAHALPQRLDAKALAAVQSAVQINAWHAIAVILVALWLTRISGPAYVAGSLAGAAFAIGTMLFCGAVYTHDIGGIRLGPVAPIGGVTLMAGWLLLASSAILPGTRS